MDFFKPIEPPTEFPPDGSIIIYKTLADSDIRIETPKQLTVVSSNSAAMVVRGEDGIRIMSLGKYQDLYCNPATKCTVVPPAQKL